MTSFLNTVTKLALHIILLDLDIFLAHTGGSSLPKQRLREKKGWRACQG